MNKSLVLIIFLLINAPLFGSNLPVKICNDSGEWAPYFYFERNPDGTKTNNLVGATIDSLNAIFEKINMEYSFELIPWKRCLAYVERFEKVQKYEMFSEAGINSWRTERYLHTKEAVYKRTNVFYYNTTKFPQGLNITTVKDMEKYKICVGGGLSYERYIKAGLNEKLVDVSHKTDYFDVIRKISLGFCDIMPANLAIIEGGIKINQFQLPDNISYEADITIDDPFYYYYWIAKTSPRSNELINKIDLAIKELKETGVWEKIYKKYLSQGSGLK